MIIFPAIDIQNGKCVRLRQGKFSDVKIYSDDPVEYASRWESEGAKFLHIVDLDGAEQSSLKNFGVIKKIRNAVRVPIQIGGGINKIETADKLIACGIDRIIIGTAAIIDKPLFGRFLTKYRDNIIVSLDAKNGKLAIKGWREQANIGSIEAALELERNGVKRFIYTDVTKDGTMTVPNYKDIKNLVDNIGVPVIAAGGISSIGAIKRLKKIGVEGVIVGKALYENKISIKEMIGI